MKLLLDIDETQIDFMLDLLSRFDFVTVETKGDELSSEEISFIEDRMAHHIANKDKSIYWEDLKNQLLENI
jgi:hypothetical protein